MLELGPDTPNLHTRLVDALDDNAIDLVFLAGEAMLNLWNVLPEGKRGYHCITTDLLADVVRQNVRPGDAVMVKGSAGVRMGRVVEALKSLNTSHQTQGEA